MSPPISPVNPAGTSKTLTDTQITLTKEAPVALIHFLIKLFTFIGVLASTSAVVLTVILILRSPSILIIVSIALLLFHWMLTRFPCFE